MRFDRFTIKSQELIQSAQTLASTHGNQQIEPVHLLASMLDEKEGVARSVFKRLGVSGDSIASAAVKAIDRLPKVSGGDVYLSSAAKAVLEAAFAEAGKMKDEYTSIEHILLAMCDKQAGEASRILNSSGVNRDAILKVLMEIRGNQRITDPNPEEKYEALKKFSRDLTDMARSGKLDPVIGRDDEIRRIVQVLSRRTKNNPVWARPPSWRAWPSALWPVMSPRA